MKKILFYLIVFCSIVGCSKKQFIMTGKHNNAPIRGQYIVIMEDSFATPILDGRDTNNKRIDKDQAKRAMIDAKLKQYLVERGIKEDNIMAFSDLKVMAIVHTSKQTADALRDDSFVRYVIQDIAVQINPIQQTDRDEMEDPKRQWLSKVLTEINPIQQSEPRQIELEIDPSSKTSKAIITAGGYVSGLDKETVIWFLDTGLDLNNPSLNVNTALGARFVGFGLEDYFGHGTFCAGVAAGKPVGTNSYPKFHIGVSEGATVVPVKVLDGRGKGTWGSVIAGLNHVAQKSSVGDIVNVSIGTYDISNPDCSYPALRELLERVTTIGGNKSVFVTLSAGNDSGNAIFNRAGCISDLNIFTSSSINADSTCAVYSNFGIPPVDFVSVGTRVFSLWEDGNFRLASGTSVSSAILAGIIHAKGSAPTSLHTVPCKGHDYKIANWH